MKRFECESRQTSLKGTLRSDAQQAADGPAERLVRINSPSSGLAQDDLEIIVSLVYYRTVSSIIADSAA